MFHRVQHIFVMKEPSLSLDVSHPSSLALSSLPCPSSSLLFSVGMQSFHFWKFHVTGTGSTVETFSLREERSGGRRACFGRQPADSEIRLREAAAGRAQGRGVESPGSDTLRCYFLGAETRPSGGLKGCRLCSFRSGLGRGPSSSNRDDHAGKSGPQVGEPERQ